MKITKKQIGLIVRLFHGGSTIANLAQSYGLPIEKIEDIIRGAMLGLPEEKS